MKTEAYIIDSYGEPKITIHESQAPNFEARIALSLVERWGLVAADVDGEDTAGRSKLRRLTPHELTRDACETAAGLVAEFERRGWMVELPSPTEHMAAKKAEKEREKEE